MQGYATKHDGAREAHSLRDNVPTPDAGYIAQGAAQIREITADVADLLRRLASVNDRLMGPEVQEATPPHGESHKPFSDVDALAQNLLGLRLTVQRLYQEVVRSERL